VKERRDNSLERLFIGAHRDKMTRTAFLPHDGRDEGVARACVIFKLMARPGEIEPVIRSAGVFLILFGVVGAIVQGLVGLAAAWLLGVGPGDALLVAILFGSASYIAVPAAMRLALPEANPSLYIALPMAVTFPFNILVGIPMYHLLIGALGIGAGGP